jgi:tripartite-type tricarboxylate transporter receptor subunit TctC
MVVKDGRARMLLALTVDPILGFPEVPTFKKVFGKDTFNAAGYMGPSGIPESIVKKLEKAVYEGTKDPGFLKATENMSMTPMWKGSKEITQHVNTVLSNFEEFLKDLGLLKK